VAVSEAVRRYYATRIFAQSGRGHAPPNFRPLEGEASGFSTVEGCRGGGKNILEVFVRGDAERLEDLRLSCGLCNPAMYACADVVADWARGRTWAEILDLDASDPTAWDDLWEALGGPGRPDDAREKFQYVLRALKDAVRNHLGQPPLPPVEIEEPGSRDWAEEGDGETPRRRASGQEGMR
jgi:hypothetical protein